MHGRASSHLKLLQPAACSRPHAVTWGATGVGCVYQPTTPHPTNDMQSQCPFKLNTHACMACQPIMLLLDTRAGYCNTTPAAPHFQAHPHTPQPPKCWLSASQSTISIPSVHTQIHGKPNTLPHKSRHPVHVQHATIACSTCRVVKQQRIHRPQQGNTLRAKDRVKKRSSARSTQHSHLLRKARVSIGDTTA